MDDWNRYSSAVRRFRQTYVISIRQLLVATVRLKWGISFFLIELQERYNSIYTSSLSVSNVSTNIKTEVQLIHTLDAFQSPHLWVYPLTCPTRTLLVTRTHNMCHHTTAHPHNVFYKHTHSLASWQLVIPLLTVQWYSHVHVLAAGW